MIFASFLANKYRRKVVFNVPCCQLNLNETCKKIIPNKLAPSLLPSRSFNIDVINSTKTSSLSPAPASSSSYHTRSAQIDMTILVFVILCFILIALILVLLLNEKAKKCKTRTITPPMDTKAVESNGAAVTAVANENHNNDTTSEKTSKPDIWNTKPSYMATQLNTAGVAARNEENPMASDYIVLKNPILDNAPKSLPSRSRHARKGSEEVIIVGTKSVVANNFEKYDDEPNIPFNDFPPFLQHENINEVKVRADTSPNTMETSRHSSVDQSKFNGKLPEEYSSSGLPQMQDHYRTRSKTDIESQSSMGRKRYQNDSIYNVLRTDQLDQSSSDYQRLQRTNQATSNHVIDNAPHEADDKSPKREIFSNYVTDFVVTSQLEKASLNSEDDNYHNINSSPRKSIQSDNELQDTASAEGSTIEESDEL